MDGIPGLDGPRISHVNPNVVLPGTFVDIHGDNLGESYSDTIVTISGKEVLVLRVTSQKVTVRIPPERGELDPLIVNVGGKVGKLIDG